LNEIVEEYQNKVKYESFSEYHGNIEQKSNFQIDFAENINLNSKTEKKNTIKQEIMEKPKISLLDIDTIKKGEFEFNNYPTFKIQPTTPKQSFYQEKKSNYDKTDTNYLYSTSPMISPRSKKSINYDKPYNSIKSSPRQKNFLNRIKEILNEEDVDNNYRTEINFTFPQKDFDNNENKMEIIENEEKVEEVTDVYSLQFFEEGYLSSVIPMCLVSMKGVFLSANISFANLVGYQVDEMTNLLVSNLTVDGYSPYTTNIMNKVIIVNIFLTYRMDQPKSKFSLFIKTH
jgi:hypothetical protein